MKFKFFVIMTALFCSFGAAAAADKPRQLHIQCGDVGVFIAPQLFWNLNGITFGKRFIGRQDHGFYGTVIRYDVGWVGTGHLENGIGETGVEVDFTRDGKVFIPSPEQSEIVCRTFTMTKKSTLHHAQLIYTLKVADGVISESVKLQMLKNQHLKIVYNFMHPWHDSFEDYRMRPADGSETSGNAPRSEKGKMLLFEQPETATLYSKSLQTALFSTVSAQNSAPLGHWLLWNRGEQDRKLYFRPLFEKTVSAGEVMQWQMKTTFRRMDFADWQKLDLEKLHF